MNIWVEPVVKVTGFTRNEVMSLTGCTSSRLAYLEKAGLIVPERIGIAQKPIVLFSWEQVLGIVAAKNLRKDVSLQVVRKIIDFLNQSGYNDSLKNKLLVVVNDNVFWVQPGSDELQQHIEQMMSNGKSQQAWQFEVVIVSSLAKIVDDLWKAAQNSKAIDFEDFKQRLGGNND